MAFRFNADEVFEVAIKIEQNGAAFYRKAASLQSESGNRSFLEKLALMEDGHERTFVAMRAELPGRAKESVVFDPEGETSLYLEAMADVHGGEGSPSAAEKLTGRESMLEVVQIALGLEKKSILYYLGLRDFVPARLGQDRIDTIIKEEQSHVAQLTGIQKNLSAR